MHTDSRPRSRRAHAASWLVLLLTFLLAACGGGDGGGGSDTAFVIDPTPIPTPPGGGTETPPPDAAAAVWLPNAHAHTHIATFGSFPSGLDLYDNTLFVTDADQIESAGVRIVPLEISAGAPVPSTRYATTQIVAGQLLDFQGTAADINSPIGFGFFTNEVRVMTPTLGLALVNAAGSDSAPSLSNLVVFNPTTGTVRQVVNLSNTYNPRVPLVDSTGAAVPGGSFIQSGAEALAVVPVSATSARLYVAMSNLVFGAPSNGSTKYPGTIQVYDVDPEAVTPVTTTTDPTFATRTITTHGYNPVALTVIQTTAGTLRSRLVVTVAGTTGFDMNFDLVPLTRASIEIYDAVTGAFEGSFDLGLTGLAGVRPALGRDAAGHQIGFFPSSVTGEVYLLQLDGLYDPVIDASRLAVLRGAGNGIPITAASSGGAGGNLTGVGLSPDGKTLVVSGFGDLFAFPTPVPGQLFLLTLPDDVVTGAGFGASFTPGSTLFGSTPGRTLSEFVLVPRAGGGPEVYVNIGGSLDGMSFLGDGPASVGTLDTGGLIR